MRSKNNRPAETSRDSQALNPSRTSDSSTDRIRIFISYSSDDRDTVEKVAEILETEERQVIWDKHLLYGSGFHAQIKRLIEHAHIFMPLLTKSSTNKQWVQQEIGYAVALRVPVVPIAIGCDPDAFLHGIQAINLAPDNLKELSSKVQENPLDRCMAGAEGTVALYECAETTEERAVMFREYCAAVANLGHFGFVRQSGGLSSFHIPRATLRDHVWTARYGKRAVGDYHKKVLRQERLALGAHARRCGCRIIVDPELNYKYWGKQAKKFRLESIRNFLISMKSQTCEVALAHDTQESLTIVGDWFAARSVRSDYGKGYTQTIFTRHAKTVTETIREFDVTFEQHLKTSYPDRPDCSRQESRQAAIDHLDKLLREPE